MFVGAITGNVGKDAELKYMADKTPVVNFSVASTKKASGKEITTWVNVSFWGDRAEKVSGYITKGKLLTVYGEVTNRPYEKDGETRYSLEIRADNVRLLGGGTDSTTSSTASDNAGKAISTTADLF